MNNGERFAPRYETELLYGAITTRLNVWLHTHFSLFFQEDAAELKPTTRPLKSLPFHEQSAHSLQARTALAVEDKIAA